MDNPFPEAQWSLHLDQPCKEISNQKFFFIFQYCDSFIFFSQLGALQVKISTFESFTLKIAVVFLLTVCQTILMMLVKKIWFWIGY